MSTGIELAVVIWDLGVLLSALAARAAAGHGEAAERRRILQDNPVARSMENADVLVEREDGQVVGLQQDEQGAYKVMPGSAPEAQNEGRLKQQYAALKVKQEAQDKGYNVVEEQVMPDQSVRLVLRRWE